MTRPAKAASVLADLFGAGCAVGLFLLIKVAFGRIRLFHTDHVPDNRALVRIGVAAAGLA
ncbi:MAG: hypothetical protein ABW215_07315 [Kibdelosporangium sp.]